MTISRSAKEEISALPPKSCCRRARFSAALRTAGSMLLGGGGLRVQLSTDDPGLSGFAAAYAFEKYGGDVEIRRGKHMTVLFTGDYVTRLLVECGVLSGQAGGYATVESIAPFLVKSNCCVKEYVKGAFLGCGFLSSDMRHLEFAFASENIAADFARLIGGALSAPGRARRGDKHIVYYTGKGRISDALAYMGAVKAALITNDSIVRSDIKRKAVARQNCDLANIDRALKASEQQAAAIDIISREAGEGSLDEKLAEIARLRKEYPEASLSELAELSGLTKSGVKHRLDRLVEMAAKFTENGNNI